MTRLFLLLAASAAPALAQTQVGTAPIAPVGTVSPSTMGGQVRQPPANSAMRQAGGFGVGVSAAANPMGMAGMGAGMSAGATGGLTLSADGGESTGGAMSSGAMSSGAGQSPTTRIGDTGVTRRTPAGAAPR